MQNQAANEGTVEEWIESIWTYMERFYPLVMLDELDNMAEPFLNDSKTRVLAKRK